jgi:hypothetical protein
MDYGYKKYGLYVRSYNYLTNCEILRFCMAEKYKRRNQHRHVNSKFDKGL